MITLAPVSPVKKSSPSRKALALVALLTLSGSALAGCGGSGDDDGGASVSPSASASETTPAPSVSTEPAPAPAPASSPATAGAPAAGPVPCTADMLSGVVENVPGGAGADGISRLLVLTNISTDGTCTVAGYPGVSYLDAAGQQVGAPAARTEGAAAVPVTLAPGQAATAELRETAGQKYGACVVRETASLLVYPPEDTASLTVAHPSTGCENTNIQLLSVGVLQAR